MTPLLQSGSHDDGLEGGTGLVLSVQTLVAPLLELGLAKGCSIFLLADRLILLQLRQVLLQDRINDGTGVVEVIVGSWPWPARRLLSGSITAERAVDDIELLDALLQRLLRVHLDGGVDGGVHIVAAHRILIAGIRGEQFRARRSSR